MTTTLLALLLFGIVAYLIARRKDGGESAPPRGGGGSASPVESIDHLTPRPLKPRLHVHDWDGFSGLQAALCMKLSDGTFVPVVEAGTAPPASRTQTLSTARALQDRICATLYAVVPGAENHAMLVQEVSIGPIDRTGEDIRSVDLVCTIDEDGTVWVRGESGDGREVPCTVMVQGEHRISVGRTK